MAEVLKKSIDPVINREEFPSNSHKSKLVICDIKRGYVEIPLDSIQRVYEHPELNTILVILHDGRRYYGECIRGNFSGLVKGGIK